MDTPGDFWHFLDVLVSLYQELNRLLHHLVKRVSDREKELCKLLHILKNRDKDYTNTRNLYKSIINFNKKTVFNAYQCFSLPPTSELPAPSTSLCWTPAAGPVPSLGSYPGGLAGEGLRSARQRLPLLQGASGASGPIRAAAVGGRVVKLPTTSLYSCTERGDKFILRCCKTAVLHSKNNHLKYIMLKHIENILTAMCREGKTSKIICQHFKWILKYWT